jgi:hypothetical protein
MPNNHCSTNSQKLIQLFDELCTLAPKISVCPHCGSEMVNFDAVFFLSDSERSWNIPLPVCPTCEEGVQRLGAFSHRNSAA